MKSNTLVATRVTSSSSVALYLVWGEAAINDVSNGA